LDILFREAAEADAPLLARMNRRLIEDEGSPNPMSLEHLQSRMEGWFRDGWQVLLFDGEAGCMGYTLYQQRRDDYFPEKPVVYVRHFFIDREHRGGGLGSRIFSLLKEQYFPHPCTVVLDVLATNPRGRHFWDSLGFQPYCTTLKLPNE
jgi:GNAT superfamily N-acetyltransferase